MPSGATTAHGLAKGFVVSSERLEPAFDRGVDGLLPTVAQDAHSGQVLMVAWMNAESFAATCRTGRATYYSRSRRALWQKGDTSGHTQRVVEIRVDCDADTILLRVEQVGAACHEGYRSCFFRRLDWHTLSATITDSKLDLSPQETSSVNCMSAEANLKRLGIELPVAPKPMGVYQPVVVTGKLAYISGHGPLKADKTLIIGRLGADMDVKAGYDAARVTGLAMLATLKSHFGSLDKIARVVKVLGLVRCTETFDQQPAVINGCSELFRDVFASDADPLSGVAARSAIGTNALPGGIAVEIEAIFELA
jgi:phosphoribosyl-AMP cyclohydrolase/enamine deaminase RidA (YjgF/YER057c/UK114 family)